MRALGHQLSFVRLALFILFCISISQAQWTHEITVTHPLRMSTGKLRIWSETSKIKGVLLCSSIGNGNKFSTQSKVRETLKRNELGIIYIQTQELKMSVFDYAKDSSFFFSLLDSAAALTNNSQFRYAPWILFGHSTDGIFAQNIAVWHPERVLGVLHYKSGNLGNVKNMKGDYLSIQPLQDIPFLSLNGRFEEYGPNGSLSPKQSNETQWWAARDTLLQLRKKHYRVAMSVDSYGEASHTSWATESAELMAQFSQSVARTQLPEGYPDSQVPTLKRLTEAEGWLCDSSLSAMMDDSTFTANPMEAAYLEYPKEKRESAFWHSDREMALAWIKFHLRKSSYSPTGSGIFSGREYNRSNPRNTLFQNENDQNLFYLDIFNAEKNQLFNVTGRSLR